MQSLKCTMRRISKKETTGFEDFRKYVKHGQDFTKELALIMQERVELDAMYAKSLSKLAAKLAKAGKDCSVNGTIGNTWFVAADNMEAEAEIHRVISVALGEEVVKPLKSLCEAQCRVRKGVETLVDKANKSLTEWRLAEAKAKAKCYICCKENEKAQNKATGNNSGASVLATSSNAASSEKELTKVAKAELRKKKAAECVRRADLEYYSFCLRAERARSDWENSVNKGANCFLMLEEERLQCLQESAFAYHRAMKDIGSKLQWGTNRVGEALKNCDSAADLAPVKVMKKDSEGNTEQLLPDFYAEDMTNAMNRDRRKEVLRKFLGMLVQDLSREKKGKEGMENLVRAMTEGPKLVTNGSNSKEDVLEKLKHMQTMVAYLEAAKYKVELALAEANGETVADPNHPLAKYMQVQKDKQGFVQTVLKVPPDIQCSEFSNIDNSLLSTEWLERGSGDGIPSSPIQDEFPDEFSSQGEDTTEYQDAVLGDNRLANSVSRQNSTRKRVDSGETSSVQSHSTITCASPTAPSAPEMPRDAPKCKVLYDYEAQHPDELTIQPGDVIEILEKQEDGWWHGNVDGAIGIFPSTYVEEI